MAENVGAQQEDASPMRLARLLLLGLFLYPVTPAMAQLTPSSAHTTVGAGTGLNSGTSPTGGYGATVPFDFPAPRGAIPVPLSVAYTSSPRVGAGGAGWDVPLSYVRVSKSVARRKPSIYAGTCCPWLDPVPERVLLSIGGSTTVMLDGDDDGVYTPFAAGSYLRLERTGLTWTARDSEGRRYVFWPANDLGPGVHDDRLWLLREITDAAETDRVRLRYAIDGTGTHAGMPEILLDKLEYTFDVTGQTPLYTIDLQYTEWDPASNLPSQACEAQPLVTASPRILGIATDEGFFQSRSRILHRIDVLARDNLQQPTSSAIAVRGYSFSYRADVDNLLPRLTEVRMCPGSADPTAPSLPLLELGYGNAVGTEDGPALRYQQHTWNIPRYLQDGGWDARTGLSSTRTVEVGFHPHPGWRVTETTDKHFIRDLTGDGLPDLVFEDAGKRWLVPNVISDGRPILDQANEKLPINLPIPLSKTVTYIPKQPWNLPHFLRTSFSLTTVALIDWNGDGRLDVVDAEGGIDRNHWRVFVNAPVDGSPYAIQWQEQQVDVSALRDWLTLHHPDIDFLFNAALLPISRSKSWTVGTFTFCEKWVTPGGSWQGPHPCESSELDQIDFRSKLGHTVVEWNLSDVNGDSYPDFIANSEPLREVATSSAECPTPLPDTLGEPAYNHNEPPAYKDHELDLYIGFRSCEVTIGFLPPSSQLSVFHNQAGAAGAALGQHFASSPHQLDGPACAVEAWQLFGGSSRTRVCGFDDLNGDGILDYTGPGPAGATAHLGTGEGLYGYVHAAASPSFSSNRGYACSSEYGDPEGSYTVRQTRGLVDVTGDGLPDLVELTSTGWSVAPGTGTGFAPPVPMHGPFDLSRSAGDCKTGDERSIAGVTDIDGDGRPEVLQIVGDDVGFEYWLRASSVVNSSGAGAHDAGRLIEVGNGYGAVRRIVYTSAKKDHHTLHRVPFPEIVVAEERVDIDYGSGTPLAPTRYAYADARLDYDSLMERWTFRGYRRRLTLRGLQVSASAPRTAGVLLVEDYRPPGTGYENIVLAGVPETTHRLEGHFPDDVWSLTSIELDAEPRLRAGAQMAHAAKPLPHIEEVSLLDGCYELIDPYTGTLGDLSLCRRTGVTYPKKISAWEGRAAPPAMQNVETGTEVLAVDDFGRPLQIWRMGDTRRSDDDTCVSLGYATPSRPGSEGMGLLHSVRVTDCGRGPAAGAVTLAGTRIGYDGLNEAPDGGSFSDGRVTRRIIERYDAQTGDLLGEFVQAELDYEGDPFGQVRSIRMTRSLGSPATRHTLLERDPWGLRVVSRLEAASDVDVTLVHTSAISSIPWRDSRTTGPNGEEHRTYYDVWGRPARSTLLLNGVEYLLASTHYDDHPDGRTVTTRDYLEWTQADAAPSDTVATTSVVHLDSLGRHRFVQLLLGSDYGGQTLVAGYRLHDPLGRVIFEADPFEADEIPFVPESLTSLPYGTSQAFDHGGRVSASVRAPGYMPMALAPDDQLDIYPTTIAYDWVSGQAIVRRRGPNELSSTMPQSGSVDETTTSATGQVLSEARVGADGARIELSEHGYNRLGAQTTLRRYRNPQTRSDSTAWNMRYDSLGQLLSLQEPGAAVRHSSYDEWGGNIESWWQSGTVRHAESTRFDGFGRPLESSVYTLDTSTSAVSIAWRARYGYDLPFHDPDADIHAPDSHLLGRLAYARVDAAVGEYYSYDALGRSTRVSRREETGTGTGVFTELRDYQPDGRVRRLRFALPDIAESVEYSYDSAGRTLAVDLIDEVGHRNLFRALSVDARGNYLTAALGNGAYEQFFYSPTGRRELERHHVSFGRRYYERIYDSYDGEGRLLREREGLSEPFGTAIHQTATYSYDPLNRLSEARRFDKAGTYLDHQFRFDALGNLEARKDLLSGAHLTPLLESSDRDRLRQVDGCGGDPKIRCRYSYDGVGNVTEILRQPIQSWMPAPNDPATRFHYDAASRLTEIHRGNKHLQLSYGPFNDLFSLSLTGSSAPRHERRYGPLVAEAFFTSPHGYAITRQIPGPLGIIAELRGKGQDKVILYRHGDANANRLFVDDAETLAQRLIYGPFGDVLQDTGSPGSRSYTYRQWNFGDAIRELDVVLLGARVYHPETGRFLQRDPLFAAPTGSAANPYAFAFGDPVNLNDPTGLSPYLAISQSGDGPSTGFTTPSSSGPSHPGMGAPAPDWGRWLLANLAWSLYQYYATEPRSQPQPAFYSGPEGLAVMAEGDLAYNVAPHNINRGYSEVRVERGRYRVESPGYHWADREVFERMDREEQDRDLTRSPMWNEVFLLAMSSGFGGMSPGRQAPPLRVAAVAVKPVRGRKPINSRYAGTVLPASKLPKEIRGKYHHGVPFNARGFPDFKRYSIAEVRIQLTGNRNADAAAANSRAGFRKTPDNYTWHHHQDPGLMQLVPLDLHDAVRHTGGVATSGLPY